MQIQEPNQIAQSMVISISSVSTTAQFEVVTTSPTPTMEDIVGYVPPHQQATSVIKLVPVRPSGKSHVDRPSPSKTTWGKRSGNRKRKGKAMTPPTPPHQ